MPKILRDLQILSLLDGGATAKEVAYLLKMALRTVYNVRARRQAISDSWRQIRGAAL